MTGRPPHFATPQALEEKIKDYFNYCDKNCQDYTMGGLGLHLGFVSRQSFTDYSKNSEFSDIIKKARYIVETGYEKNLHHGQCTGSIFALKAMGWEDGDKQANNTTIIIKDKDKEIVDRILNKPTQD